MSVLQLWRLCDWLLANDLLRGAGRDDCDRMFSAWPDDGVNGTVKNAVRWIGATFELTPPIVAEVVRSAIRGRDRG